MTRGNSERLERLERLLGEPASGEHAPVFERLDHLHGGMATRETSLNSLSGTTEERFKDLLDAMNQIVGKLRSHQEDLESEITILKKAVGAPSLGGDERMRVKVPEPQTFNGTRDAKSLQNFLWDVEQYLEAARIPEAERVSITSMYLVGDAKLWWRTRVKDDLSAGRPKIDFWESLKKELTDQFLPCNVSWVAREALKSLKHSSTVREYVKEFTYLMLDITDMFEADKLFNFLDGLQSWAQLELRRQGVKDLPSAIAAADAFVDLRMSGAGEHMGKDGAKEKWPWHEGINGRRNG